MQRGAMKTNERRQTKECAWKRGKRKAPRIVSRRGGGREEERDDVRSGVKDTAGWWVDIWKLDGKQR